MPRRYLSQNPDGPDTDQPVAAVIEGGLRCRSIPQTVPVVTDKPKGVGREGFGSHPGVACPSGSGQPRSHGHRSALIRVRHRGKGVDPQRLRELVDCADDRSLFGDAIRRTGSVPNQSTA
jgi:hypothetical protein